MREPLPSLEATIPSGVQRSHFPDEKEAGRCKGDIADEWQGQDSNLTPLSAEVTSVLNHHRGSPSSTQHAPRSFGCPSSTALLLSFKLTSYV